MLNIVPQDVPKSKSSYDLIMVRFMYVILRSLQQQGQPTWKFLCHDMFFDTIDQNKT